MCGIAGCADPGGMLGDRPLADVAAAMIGPLAHRGPDDMGTWSDDERRIAFGHRRLAVIDLSPEGHQPMTSGSGRYVTVFNGEIYNFHQLRRDLESRGHRFRGGSDTEVLLASCDEWGVADAAARWSGMFALAIWDTNDRRLWLLRDRIGEKPLFYGWTGGLFVFASELKAIELVPGFNSRVDRRSLVSYLRHGYVPDPHSIYAGLEKLPAGGCLELPLASGDHAPSSVIHRYWTLPGASPRTIGERGRARPDATSMVDALEAELRDAVTARMVADVPLGAFLSGGIDSSIVVALMRSANTGPVRTFSIGFREEGYDEAAYAGAVARHLGTDHTEFYVSPSDAREVIPRLPIMYDEPFADHSQIPTFLVSQLARRDVTVALSGDGGDELFAGYDRYAWTRAIWRRLRLTPPPARRAAARILAAVPPRAVDRLASASGLGPRLSGKRVRRIGEVLDSASPDALYLQILSHTQDPAGLVIGGEEWPPLTIGGGASIDDVSDAMMTRDILDYLPGDILTKVDRASMAVALEVRVPMLDPGVIELARSLPLSVKVRDGRTKWILREVLYRHVPPALVERPKMGFGVPIRDWLRGPLSKWADDLLSPDRLSGGGWFDGERVGRLWQEHRSGVQDWQYVLWDVLMFQAWLDAHGQ